MADPEKKCSTCKKSKPLAEYNKRSRSKDGHDDLCRACASDQHRREYQRNRETIKNKAARYYADNKKKCNVRSIEYYRKTQPLKPQTVCACGCGEMAAPGRAFIVGHKNKGRQWSEEIREKMSESRKLAVTTEYRLMVSDRFRGRIQSQDERARRLKTKQRGESHHAWNGGSSFETYGRDWNRSTRKIVFERDSGKCQNPGCLEKCKRLNVHHIDYDKKNSQLDNLITLCTSCHAATNSNRGKWEPFYAEVMRNKIMLIANVVRIANVC
ncbi:MAG: HNH endonuclease [Syntrophus sp. (in: bacteria)]